MDTMVITWDMAGQLLSAKDMPNRNVHPIQRMENPMQGMESKWLPWCTIHHDDSLSGISIHHNATARF